MARERDRHGCFVRKKFRSDVIAKSLVLSQAGSRTTIRSARPSFRFLFFHFLIFLVSFSFENTFQPETALRFRNDLQSSTPEEYLDGRILADEAGLGDGSLAVEGDGGLPAQSRIDDRRNLLLLLQRLLLVSEKHQDTIFVGGKS